MLYTFDFIDDRDEIDHIDIAVYADDHEAKRAAVEALFKARLSVGVIVWERSRKVATITRKRHVAPWLSPRDGLTSHS
jgi:hypothetical protein